ncbi:hypothetical protein [Streptomyces triticagri]|uniref:hypothetical protein n=1 Tax=Streptomyces triticagri TaxID=2293568 RepID=UPI0018F61919|nr:hypothetical protein [Streptomyces triticagri]
MTAPAGTERQDAPGRTDPRTYRDAAREDGLVPALTLLTRALEPGAVPRGPGGHAVLPREVVEEAGVPAESAGAGADRPYGAGRSLAGALGLAVLDPPADREPYASPNPDGTAAQPPCAGTGTGTDWTTGLAWLRLGSSEALRDLCLKWLAERESEGSSLLMKQMVKGALAEVLIEQLEIAAVLESGPSAPVVERLQEQITGADRGLLRLLGAYGFTGDGPGRDAYASELLADVYRGAGDRGCAGPDAAEEGAG